MQLSEILAKRTSVRSYVSSQITEEQVNELLKAGTRAPNACNLQSWHFYAVCDKQIIKAFHPHIAHIPWIENIPLLIVICVDENTVSVLQDQFGEERGRMFAYQDAAGAANLMLLRAVELGLGGCWIGPMDALRCKKRLSIREEHTPVAILTIGTPAAEMPLRDRKPLEEVVSMIGDFTGSGQASVEEERNFSLAHASLPSSQFEDLNLSDAVFCNINLRDATFTDINMSGAAFKSTSFAEASLDECDIEGMTIDGVRVKEAISAAKKASSFEGK